MINVNTICPDCFCDSFYDGICSKCGYDNLKEKKHTIALPSMTLLNDRYLIGRGIGAGGFGITYKAYDTSNNSYCAIKEYAPLGLVTRASDASYLHLITENYLGDFMHGKKRFIEEAKMLSQLDNIEHVVKIIDFFEDNNTAYYVMEYLQGVNLNQLRSSYGGRVPLNEALDIICKIGETLHYVHESLHIFHRDISPDNIMITSDGKVKLLDFGNAKYLMGNDSQTFSVVLKHGYAPPEQYSSTSLQGSYTDVYSLAATLYYIISGVKLVVAPDRLTGEDYPRLKSMNIDVSEQLSDVIDEALVLNSKKRTQTMDAFISSLRKELPKMHIKEIEFNMPKDKNHTVVKEIPSLFLVNTDKKMEWKFPADTLISLGRSNQISDIVPSNHSWISKKHCELYYDSEKKIFYIRDCSTNGTFYKGEKLEKQKVYTININDQISLGRNVCILEVRVNEC